MASNTVLAKLAVVISANTAEFNRSMKDSNKNFKSFTSTFKGGLAALGIGLGIDQLASFGKEVVKITAEFQKFEAVLTNTLGSNSLAQIAMKQIQKFAEATPFSVQELTASFVKLANQGFKPTTQELGKLGDFAAAMGKSFDQLTEAIIDAQTGEFERLKEFGIRASKEGDKVTFTFKGVKTQVDFTADSIRNYILTLGDLQGVSGGMAAISKTLGGQISNLGDQMDTLFNTIGSNSASTLGYYIGQLQMMIFYTNKLVQSTEQASKAQSLAYGSSKLEDFKTLASDIGDISRAEDIAVDNLKKQYASLQVQISNFKPASAFVEDKRDAWIQEQKDIEFAIQAIRDYTDAQLKSDKDRKEALIEQIRLKNIEKQQLEEEKRLKLAIADIDRRLNGRAQPGTNALGTSIDIAPALERAKMQMKQFTDAFKSFKAESDALVLDLSGSISGAISDIAMSIGEAFSGGEDFGKSFLKILSNFCAQVGSAAIALGITMLNLRAAFATPGAAIAAGVALLAVAGALGAASKAQDNFNRGASSSSSGGVSRSNQVRINRSQSEIILNPELIVSGANLKLVLKNQDRIDNRTGQKA